MPLTADQKIEFRQITLAPETVGGGSAGGSTAYDLAIAEGTAAPAAFGADVTFPFVVRELLIGFTTQDLVIEVSADGAAFGDDIQIPGGSHVVLAFPDGIVAFHWRHAGLATDAQIWGIA